MLEVLKTLWITVRIIKSEGKEIIILWKNNNFYNYKSKVDIKNVKKAILKFLELCKTVELEGDTKQKVKNAERSHIYSKLLIEYKKCLHIEESMYYLYYFTFHIFVSKKKLSVVNFINIFFTRNNKMEIFFLSSVL